MIPQFCKLPAGMVRQLKGLYVACHLTRYLTCHVIHHLKLAQATSFFSKICPALQD